MLGFGCCFMVQVQRPRMQLGQSLGLTLTDSVSFLLILQRRPLTRLESPYADSFDIYRLKLMAARYAPD